jgi:hypothetical protein
VRRAQQDHYDARTETSAVVPKVGYCDGGSGIRGLGDMDQLGGIKTFDEFEYDCQRQRKGKTNETLNNAGRL